MIMLFPKSKKTLGLGLLVTAFLVAVFLAMGEGALCLFIVITGAWVSFFAAYYTAVSAHQKLLQILYQQLEPERFMDMYRPMMERCRKGSKLEAVMRAHMGNAYAACGQLEQALELFESGCTKPGVAVMQQQNRCSAWVSREEPARLEQETARYHQMLAEAPAKLRTYYKDSYATLIAWIHVMQGCVTPDEHAFVQQEERFTNKLLHQLSLRLLLARIHIQMGYRDTALEELKALSAYNDALWVVQRAKVLYCEIQHWKEDTV